MALMACAASLLQPPLLQVLQDLGAGAPEDGDARQVGGQPGGDGADAGQGGRGDHDHHGQLRSAGGGHRDSRQRSGGRLRVHGCVH